MPNSSKYFPQIGFGLGLRPQHYPYIFEHKPDVDWFEVISENFMDTDGRPKKNLSLIRENYPVVMHGVALSIGTVDPLNSEYLKKLKTLMEWLEPAWISDHLCWTGIAHKNTHDLLPLPYTEEALKHIVSRIQQVQEFLGRPIALENPSTYLEFKSSSISEADFISRMVKESGCQLLLDVNNVYVSCYNHRLDAKKYIDSMPLDSVVQIHLAGHENKGTHIIDTHDGHVIDEVWELYKYVVHKAGRIPNTMIEWDDNIPEFTVLNAELDKARQAAATASNYKILFDLVGAREDHITNEVLSMQEEQQRMQDAIIRRKQTQPYTWIRSKRDFSPDEQLGVYINAYRYRLHDVVAEDYPALEYYLGTEQFENILWGLINSHASEHFNIARYANFLPEYIKNKFPKDVFAYEICILETLLTQVADIEETPVLTQEALSLLTPDDLMSSTLSLRKACVLKKFTYPVNRFYGDVINDRKPDTPAPEKSFVAVFRHQLTMWRADLEESEYLLLKNISDHMSIEEALETLDDSATESISRWFSRWINFGLLSEIKYLNRNVGGQYVIA